VTSVNSARNIGPGTKILLIQEHVELGGKNFY